MTQIHTNLYDEKLTLFILIKYINGNSMHMILIFCALG